MANVKKETKSKTKSKAKKSVKQEQVVIEENKNIIEKESYMLYFTITFVVIRLLFNGLNWFPIITNFDDLTACVITNFIMIIGTVCAMALNFMIHKKHRVNKHQFNYIKKFMFSMFCTITLLVNIFWIINYMKINAVVTILLLVIHAGIIYLYTTILFDKYVNSKIEIKSE